MLRHLPSLSQSLSRALVRASDELRSGFRRHLLVSLTAPLLVALIPARLALAATTTEMPANKVALCERVPLGAVRPRLLPCEFSVATQDVFHRRDWPTVVRIAAAARPIVARVVVKNQAFWYRPNLADISRAMCLLHSTSEADDAVATLALGALPDVAALRVGDPSDLRRLRVPLPPVRIPRDKDAGAHVRNI